MTPRERARKSAGKMWEEDNASKWMGMSIADIDEGTATLELTVAGHHCNGHGMCHGGVIFSLADSAFAFACNSRNQRTVAQHNIISYIRPASEGDRLLAVSREVSLSGRSGIYDTRVTNQNSQVIAEFRGCSRIIGGTLFKELESAK
ncbi:MAG: hydroxyphenylacetyl-CoA thioesterase PaaI [Roseovarius sp.]|nr:hydroxyphenylacetyl-CoA thioesterase PaaI [Roseovarius sp.]